MDEFDYKILECLKSDARMSYQRISENVGLGISTVVRILHSMEPKNVIDGYTVKINENKLGFSFPVFVFVRLEKQRAENFAFFEKKIKIFPEVIECWLMTGSQDYLLKIITEDVQDFERFLTEKLTTIEGVSSVDSSVPLRCAKQIQSRSGR